MGGAGVSGTAVSSGPVKVYIGANSCNVLFSK